MTLVPFSKMPTPKVTTVLPAEEVTDEAVASVRTPGVLPTAMPRAVAAGISILLKPTAKLLTTVTSMFTALLQAA